MKIKFEQLVKELNEKKYHQIYFLGGEEPYYIDHISNHIADNILAESERDFNLTIVYGKETSPQQILELALRYPMMAPYTVIVVKEAQELKNIEELSKYFESPNETTILVLCYKHKKFDMRTKFSKILEDNAAFFIGKKVYEKDISTWVEKYLNNKNYRITQKAALLLTEYLGSDLNKISNEIDKLTLVKDNDEPIDLDDIEKNIGISREYNIFELQKALSVKNNQKVTRIFNYIESNPKSTPIQLIVSVLYSFFSKLHVLQNNKENFSITAKELKILPYFEKDYKIALNNYKGKLDYIISLLKEYDLKSKGISNVGTDEAELTKELIFKILST